MKRGKVRGKTLLPPETAVLEEQCGQYTAMFSSLLPDNMKALAFCTPASFRDPEVDDIWHPAVRGEGTIGVFLYYAKECLRAVFSGCKKFILGRFGSTKLVIRSGATKLSFGTELVCSVASGGEVSTEYLSEQDRNSSHWLIVSSRGGAKTVSRLDIFYLGGRLFLAWVKASLRARNFSIDLIATVQVFRWIISLTWVVQWTWLRAVEKAINVTNPNVIFCIHESHPLSRIVWYVSCERNLHTVTIQHANITREKLWYFSTQAERAAGLRFADIYYVYSELTRDLLLPYLSSNTEVKLACGPRYSKWKNHIERLSNVLSDVKTLLFVPSLAWWDNTTVLQAVHKCVLTNKRGHVIVVRLHPNGVISLKYRIRLFLWVRSNKVRLSTRDIYRDLKEASVVVGATSSVLSEASLLGRYSISLSNPKFLYKPETADHTVNVSSFSMDDVEKVISSGPKSTELIQFQAQLLGINEPDFCL